MSLSADLRAFILDDVDCLPLLRDRVHQDTIPQEHATYPRVWYQRRGRESTHCLDDTGGPYKHTYDLEVIAETPESRDAVADALWGRLDGYAGDLGSHRAQGVFVEDQDEDYVPKAIAADAGLFVAAMSVVIWTD